MKKEKHIIRTDGEKAEILDALKEGVDQNGEGETVLNSKQERNLQFGNYIHQIPVGSHQGAIFVKANFIGQETVQMRMRTKNKSQK